MDGDKKPMMFHVNDPNQTYHESIRIKPIFKLDKVLEFLHDDKPPGKTPLEVSTYVKEKYDMELGEHNAYIALLKLQKDGYAIEEERVKSKLVFYITFDGVLLYKNGGYAQKEKDDKVEKRLPIRLQEQIVWLTVILAIGTGVLAFMEILKYFYPK